MLKKIIIFLVLILLLVCGLIFADGFFSYKDAIDNNPLKDRISVIKKEDNYTKISDVPDYYINAVIAIEDHRFYEHHGVDFISTARAIVTNISEKSIEQGGSSITQQVAKNLYFTAEKKFTRKVSELLLAHDLEKNYSKNEILELYINNIYFGDGYYCIYDACINYYGKKPSELTLYEATYLAGVPNAPSIYAPTKNIKLGSQKQKQVLDAMLKYNYISEEEYNDVLDKINDLDI